MRLRGPSSRRRCRPVYPEKNGGSRLRAACTEPNCQKLRSLRMRGIQRATDRILEFVVQGNTAIANADGLFAGGSGAAVFSGAGETPADWFIVGRSFQLLRPARLRARPSPRAHQPADQSARKIGNTLLFQLFLNSEVPMSVAKVIEIIATSSKSFEDAVKQGVLRASDTISGITGAWVQDQSVEVSKGKITEYRVILKVTFVLKGGKGD